MPFSGLVSDVDFNTIKFTPAIWSSWHHTVTFILFLQGEYSNDLAFWGNYWGISSNIGGIWSIPRGLKVIRGCEFALLYTKIIDGSILISGVSARFWGAPKSYGNLLVRFFAKNVLVFIPIQYICCGWWVILIIPWIAILCQGCSSVLANSVTLLSGMTSIRPGSNCFIMKVSLFLIQGAWDLVCIKLPRNLLVIVLPDLMFADNKGLNRFPSFLLILNIKGEQLPVNYAEV